MKRPNVLEYDIVLSPRMRMQLKIERRMDELYTAMPMPHMTASANEFYYEQMSEWVRGFLEPPLSAVQ